jgi:DHA1 family multidrug resistance protein-like MFS transporter
VGADDHLAPLAARALAGTADAVSWLYALNAGMGIVLQYPVVRIAERWLRPLPVLLIGIALMALGLGSVALASTTGLLLASVAIFSFGALLAAPGQTDGRRRTGESDGAWLVLRRQRAGAGAGRRDRELCWGALYSLGYHIGAPALPWLVCLAVGISSAIGLALLDRHLTRRSANVADAVVSYRD